MKTDYNLSIYKFTLQTENFILIENNLGIYALLYLNKKIKNRNEFENICNEYFHNFLVKKF